MKYIKSISLWAVLKTFIEYQRSKTRILFRYLDSSKSKKKEAIFGIICVAVNCKQGLYAYYPFTINGACFLEEGTCITREFLDIDNFKFWNLYASYNVE